MNPNKCGMGLQMQSSGEETEELDTSTGVAIGCTSGMETRRGSGGHDDMLRQQVKEVSSKIHYVDTFQQHSTRMKHATFLQPLPKMWPLADVHHRCR